MAVKMASTGGLRNACMVIMGMEDGELFEGTLDLGSMLRANCSN